MKSKFGGVIIEGQDSVGSKFGGVPIATSAPKEPGFFARTEQSLRERGAQLADIVDATSSGDISSTIGTDKQSIGEGIFQVVGTEFGTIGDIIGEGVISAAKMAPDNVKEFVGDSADKLLNTDIGRAGMQALSKGVEEWGVWAKDNPKAARNISAAFNIASVALPIKGGKAAKTAVLGSKPKTVIKKVPVVTSDDVVVLANKSYKRADELGGVLSAKITNRFIKDVESLTPQTKAGKVLSGDDTFSKVVERAQLLKDQPLSLRAVQEVDETLGDIIDSLIDGGKLKKEGVKVLKIQQKLRDAVAGARASDITGGKEGFKALQEGRKFYAASRKLDDIERILARAELTDNPASSIKSGFRSLASNPKRLRGYKPEEIKLIRKAAKTGIIEDTLRVTLGSRLLPIISISAGGGFGEGAIATAGSIAARGVAERGAVSRAQKVSKAIAQRATEGIK